MKNWFDSMEIYGLSWFDKKDEDELKKNMDLMVS